MAESQQNENAWKCNALLEKFTVQPAEKGEDWKTGRGRLKNTEEQNKKTKQKEKRRKLKSNKRKRRRRCNRRSRRTSGAGGTKTKAATVT